MRTIWKGIISFGLVSIPVRLYPATQKQDVKFNYLHEPCKTPIRYEKTCPNCNKPVEQEEIVLGFQVEKGKYVLIEESDLDNIPIKTTRSVDIIDFVSLQEIDPIYYDKSYYLEPGEGGEKPYALLLQAMQETGRIAIAKIAIRQKESLAILRIQRQVLVLETMFYPEEIRSPERLLLPKDLEFHPNEVKMATQLIENLSSEFQPEKYVNNYRQALMEMIHKKMDGEQIQTPAIPAPTGQVVDLMSALKASLEATSEKKAPKKRARKSG